MMGRRRTSCVVVGTSVLGWLFSRWILYQCLW